MTKKRMKAAIHRLREMMTGSLIMSVIVCTLCISGPMPEGSVQRDITLALLPVIYIIWNIIMLRKSYSVIKKKKSYYIVNLFATVLFILLSVVAFVVFPRKLYSWIFLVTCLGRFSNLGIYAKMSFAMFYTVILISIFLAPIGMGWVKKKEAEKQRYIAKMPPKLEVNPLENGKDKAQNAEENSECEVHNAELSEKKDE